MDSGAIGLQCFICGDGNLDEFGECSAQFEYNCSNYAKRFQSDEPIFCRTTRQKAPNNTYTIMKECISEQDHYRTFPKKDYRLQEECDLIESESQELAYCLCGTDLCNERPIAEQFIAFEEEHPELFSDSDNNESTSLRPTPSEMPNREKADEKSAFDADQSGLEQTEAAKGGQQQLRRHPAIHTHANDQVHKNVQNLPNAQSGSVSELSASEGTHLLVDAGSSTTPSTLKCLQCAQGNLEDSRADCAQQIVVECDRRSSATRGSDQPEYFCLTRQILIARGQNAIEKMCVTHTALVEEYGNGVDHDGCTITNAGHVRYCVCQTDECNRLTINEQISMSNPPSLDYDSTSAPSMASTQKSIISPNSQRVVSCHVCSESRLSSPEADCSKPVVVNCNKQFEDGSGIYCLSKRTQLTPTMYSLEKRCLSQGELSNQSAADSISRDALTVGCHDAYDGLVVYCICQGDHCNKSPITLQLQGDPKDTTSDHDSEVVALNPGISLQNMLGESDGDDRMTASSSVASKWQQNSWPNARATANLSNASASSGEVLSGTQNQQTQRMNSLSVPVEHFRRKDPEQRQLEAVPKQQKEQQQASRRQENNWLSSDANENNDELLSLSSSAASTRPIHQNSVITVIDTNSIISSLLHTAFVIFLFSAYIY